MDGFQINLLDSLERILEQQDAREALSDLPYEACELPLWILANSCEIVSIAPSASFKPRIRCRSGPVFQDSDFIIIAVFVVVVS